MTPPNEESAPTASYLLYNLLIVFFILTLTPYFIRSYTSPGGILHGLRVLARPHYYAIFWPRHLSTTAYEEDIPLYDLSEIPLPNIRTIFGNRGTIVHGWPSTGGIWVHDNCYGVELEFLGLPRFESSATERYSKEEDEFCKRLEWIGARFYESEVMYNREMFGGAESKVELWIGWPGAVPEGGVWMLAVAGGDGAELGVSKISNALTMKERCNAIEMLGGKFFERWEDIKHVESQGEKADGKDL